jgi:hypothetical protein
MVNSTKSLFTIKLNFNSKLKIIVIDLSVKMFSLNVEKIRLEGDRKQFGDYQEGVYKGVIWRVYRQMIKGFQWVAYLPEYRLSDLTLDEYVELRVCADERYLYMEPIGFSCSEIKDYMYKCCNHQKGVYRDFEYVRELLFKMIDYLVSLKK